MTLLKTAIGAVVLAGTAGLIGTAGPAGAADPRPPITARFQEGLVHGFLVLRTGDGKTAGSGDLTQTETNGRVRTRLVFRLRDGSVSDETAVYTQRGVFRLLTDHLVQKGPAFEKPLDMQIDTASGKVTVKYTNDSGEDKVSTDQMKLPADLGNGLLITILKNIRSEDTPLRFSYLAPTPNPRMVELEVRTAGKEPFSVAGAVHTATHYVVKIEVGGITGLLASLFGKIPADSHVWILEGPEPAFVKSEAALAPGGPPFRTELTSPIWDVPPR